jgi:type VI secretion system protein ImpG
MTRRYFEQEMQYLQEAAQAFADAHPDQAEHLDVDSVSDRDPYVERLFEGFAFLAGRVHQRLDNEMPEYTESLFQLLHPHFLKPIPALSIVEFDPNPGLVQETTVLDRGTEVRSEPVGEPALECRFRTTQQVRLQPLRLADASLQYPGDDTSRLRLQFALESGSDLAGLELDPLRLYFQAEPATASTMRLFCSRYTSHVTMKAGRGSTAALRGNQWVQPAGLTPEESLLPGAPTAYSGFRLLQEYFCFRRKFWFVDLLGFERVEVPADAERLEVAVHFDRAYPEARRITTENVRLYCTPVVNLFDQDAEPIRVTGEAEEHRVVPSARHPTGIQTYDVQGVTGLEEATGVRHDYRPFFSFEHGAPAAADGETDRRYRTSRRTGPDGRPAVYLSFSDAQLRGLADVPAETITPSLRCTNGTRPREALTEGMINRLAPDVPDVATPRNLTQPTLLRPPPSKEQDDYFWKLISHWALNYTSVADTDALGAILQLYDWVDDAANRQRRASLQQVSWAPKEVLDQGAVLRGSEVTLSVEEDQFADAGDLCLFGQVMNRFLSTYATINSFVDLTITTIPSERTFEWTTHRGHRPNL